MIFGTEGSMCAGMKKHQIRVMAILRSINIVNGLLLGAPLNIKANIMIVPAELDDFAAMTPCKQFKGYLVRRTWCRYFDM